MVDRAGACCAGFYELPLVASLLGDGFHPGGADLTRTLASAVLVGRESLVLDVACGRGDSARLLAARFGCRVIGLDYSATNIDHATAAAARKGLSGQVRFLRGDAGRLPCACGTFDVVICECSLCTFTDLPGALKEMLRVLKPGGRLGLSDVVLNEAVPESLLGALGRALCIGGALPLAGYREALVAVGYTTVRTRDVSGVLNDMIARIERRAHGMQDLLNGADIELPDGLSISRTEVAAARNFVKAGGLGYALMSARKALDQTRAVHETI